MRRRQPNWASELRLSVFDETDGAADGSAPDGTVAGSVPDEPTGVPVPMRWCALLAALAVALAVAGGSLLNSRRDRTVTSTVVQYRYPAGVDLTGCPRGDACYPLTRSDQAVTAQLPSELVTATVLASSLLMDTTTETTIGTLQVLTADGLTMAVTARCIPGGAPVASRETEPTRPADGGPTELAFIRPGRLPGCSVALTAQVPVGMPVPTPRLRQLADELPQQLVN
jgi:hypothetical protein